MPLFNDRISSINKIKNELAKLPTYQKERQKLWHYWQEQITKNQNTATREWINETKRLLKQPPITDKKYQQAQEENETLTQLYQTFLRLIEDKNFSSKSSEQIKEEIANIKRKQFSGRKWCGYVDICEEKAIKLKDYQPQFFPQLKILEKNKTELITFISQLTSFFNQLTKQDQPHPELIKKIDGDNWEEKINDLDLTDLEITKTEYQQKFFDYLTNYYQETPFFFPAVISHTHHTFNY